MNNATNHAFRSHLMQQFVAQARTQSRPPLAMMSLISDDGDITTNTATDQSNKNGNGCSPLRRHSSLPTNMSSNTIAAASLPRINNASLGLKQHQNHRGLRLKPIAPRFSSTAAKIQEDENDDEDASISLGGFQPNLSLLFQDMLQTRRSSSRFLPHGIKHSSSSLLGELSSSSAAAADDDAEDDEESTRLQQQQQYWKQVLERAVQCGCQAPNHKRTEPFTFKRMIAPSPATERLADIFYHVTLRKQQQQQQQQQNSSSLVNDINQQEQPASTAAVLEEMERTAQRKREKWSQIPAFLVTIVSTPSTSTSSIDDEEHNVDDCNDNNTNFDYSDDEMMNDEYLYEPLPYTPPPNERALEDYASACAATQNVLLSLHSEHVASKWVTGPVIRTRAFRNLVLGRRNRYAENHKDDNNQTSNINNRHQNTNNNNNNINDRIVALIPVGHYLPTSSSLSASASSSHQQGEEDTFLINTTSSSQHHHHHHQQRGDEFLAPSSSTTMEQQQQQFYHNGRRRRYKRPLHGDLLVDL